MKGGKCVQIDYSFWLVDQEFFLTGFELPVLGEVR